ncbi:hypothetical protein LINPERPRIM_LOCUS34470, partial [Linum perenne]
MWTCQLGFHVTQVSLRGKFSPNQLNPLTKTQTKTPNPITKTQTKTQSHPNPIPTRRRRRPSPPGRRRRPSPPGRRHRTDAATEVAVAAATVTPDLDPLTTALNPTRRRRQAPMSHPINTATTSRSEKSNGHPSSNHNRSDF